MFFSLLFLSFVVSTFCDDVCSSTVVHLRDRPCGNISTSSFSGQRFTKTGNSQHIPSSKCRLGEYTWIEFNNKLWAAESFFYPCNVFGIGLVNPGDSNQLNNAKQLVGNKGWVLLIFPGVQKGTTSPDPSWVNSLNEAYSLGLNVILRLGPPWGQSHYRDWSDDDNHYIYTSLAQSFKSVISQLPMNPNGNLYFQIDNEPDLCYEWFCGKAESSALGYQEIASEYAHFLNDVVEAIKSLKNPKIKVSLGALAPGGGLQCGCCGQPNCPGDKAGITGLQFLQAMNLSVPGIFHKLDFWTSHSYPAQGVGWGFNVPYDQGITGLKYYELELKTIGRQDLPVAITETGWATTRQPTCSEDQKAQWTVESYKNVWQPDGKIMAVTPFMLMDGYWGDKIGFGYVKMSGDKLPVFTQVKNFRCQISKWTGEC